MPLEPLVLAGITAVAWSPALHMFPWHILASFRLETALTGKEHLQ